MRQQRKEKRRTKSVSKIANGDAEKEEMRKEQVGRRMERHTGIYKQSVWDESDRWKDRKVETGRKKAAVAAPNAAKPPSSLV